MTTAERTGQAVFEQWAAFIRRYVSCTEAQLVTLTLFALSTHFAEKFFAVPYLNVCGKVKRCGKTTVLDAMMMICFNALKCSTIRTAPMVRLIERFGVGRITLAFDEAERLERNGISDERAMLASGYTRGAYHPVTIGQEVKLFPTFCVKMFASIGNLQEVLHDRSIIIELQRSTPHASLRDEWQIAEATAKELHASLHAFMNGKRIVMSTPDWLRDRDREIWTPLISVAHTLNLHKDTMDLLTAASVDLSRLQKRRPLLSWRNVADERKEDERGDAAQLMADVRSVLTEADTAAKAVFSADLVGRLRALPVAPWRVYQDTGLTELSLANLLRHYGLVPAVQTIGSGRKTRKQARGYRTTDLRKAEEIHGVAPADDEPQA